MPKAYSQVVSSVAGSGYVARMQFTREDGVEDVLVSAAFADESGSLPAEASFEVRTLERDGTQIDAIALTPNERGGAQVGVHLLRVGRVNRFQVVVLSNGAGVISGRLTAVHGLASEVGPLLAAAVDASGGVGTQTQTECVRIETTPLSAAGLKRCDVPPQCRRNIVPLYTRPTLLPSFVSGVAPAIDYTCQGGVRVVP